MLSPQLRRKVHDLWSLFWSSGLSNPLVAIEQITYLLFIRQLEALDRERVKQGKRSIYAPDILKDGGIIQIVAGEGYDTCRWTYIRQNPSFPLLNDTVFPWLRSLEQRVGSAQNGNTTLGRISGRLSDAYFILDVNKTDTLKRAVSLIDDLFRQLDTRSVNSDIMGDIFEYLLEEVKESGKNGQFRTPRHVIRLMVQLLKPELGKTILDPACGSGGFLLNSLLQWKTGRLQRLAARRGRPGATRQVVRLRGGRAAACTSGVLNPRESKALPSSYEPPEDHFIKPGDLLITRANTAELVGATVLVGKECPANLVLPDKIWRFVWKDAFEGTPEFVWALFQEPATRQALGNIASGTGGSMKNISMKKLMQMRVIWPPKDLQETLSEALRQVALLTDGSRGDKASHSLQSSLSAHAFSGQLTADWREAHADRLAEEARERDAALSKPEPHYPAPGAPRFRRRKVSSSSAPTASIRI